jgi:hypothetical protein
VGSETAQRYRRSGIVTARKKTIQGRILAEMKKHKAAVEAADQKALDFIFGDAEKSIAAHETGLPFRKRLEILKTMKAWPRIVRGLYEPRDRREPDKRKPSPPTRGTLSGSDIAYSIVGEAIDVSEHRVKALCREGRRDEAAGAPKQPRMSVANFKKYWSSSR